MRDDPILNKLVRDRAALLDKDIVVHFGGQRPADIVEVLNERTPAEAAQVLLAMPHELVIEVFDQPGLERGPEIMASLPRSQAAEWIDSISADRVADLFRNMHPVIRDDLLPHLNQQTRDMLETLLAFPEESAGGIMTTEFVAASPTWTIAETLDHIRLVERTRETVYSVFVIDPDQHTLINAVPLRRLISGDPHANILSAAPARRPVKVAEHARREEAIRLISKYDLLAVPVVDDSNRVVGIVTVDDVIDTMIQHQTSQVQRFGGLEALDAPYMDISFWQMIRKRAGWLCVLFLSEMLTASAMQGFEGELEKAIVLTLFIPLIMSSGGNSGSQATSLIIRALALHQLRLGDWWRVALRELPAGITLGAILGVIGVVRIAIWQKTGLYDYGEHWPLVATTVGAALIGIVTFGSMSGSMLPFILQRIGFDPATASAPFVATLVDVTGLVIYFSVAIVILRGTLL